MSRILVLFGVQVPEAPVADEGRKARINKLILDALSKGRAVQFRDRAKGFVKVIRSWQPRADGELLCDLSTGKSKYLDPYRTSYDITVL